MINRLICNRIIDNYNAPTTPVNFYDNAGWQKTCAKNRKNPVKKERHRKNIERKKGKDHCLLLLHCTIAICYGCSSLRPRHTASPAQCVPIFAQSVPIMNGKTRSRALRPQILSRTKKRLCRLFVMSRMENKNEQWAMSMTVYMI